MGIVYFAHPKNDVAALLYPHSNNMGFSQIEIFRLLRYKFNYYVAKSITLKVFKPSASELKLVKLKEYKVKQYDNVVVTTRELLLNYNFSDFYTNWKSEGRWRGIMNSDVKKYYTDCGSGIVVGDGGRVGV